MDEIINSVIPPPIMIFQPTHNITLDIQQLYNIEPNTTLSILSNISKFKDLLQTSLINKLKENENTYKHNQYKYIQDYYTIKGNPEIENNLSIFSHIKVHLSIINLPAFLYYKPINTFHNNCLNEYKCTIENGNKKTIRIKNQLICTKGIINKIKTENYLISKLFVCLNNKCKKRSTFLIIYRVPSHTKTISNNSNEIIYFVEENKYYLIINYRNICFNCEIKVVEDVKSRNIKINNNYLISDNFENFNSWSFNELNGNLHFGIILRNKKGKMIFEVFSSTTTSLTTKRFLENKPRILSNFLYFENVVEFQLKKYVKKHLFFLKEFADAEISLIIILHLFLLFNCSIAIITNESGFVSIISKNFFNFYALEIPILYAHEDKFGLYIYDYRYKLEKKEFEEIEYRFVLKIDDVSNKIIYSYDRTINKRYEFVILYTKLDFKNQLENLTRKFLDENISSDRIIKTCASIRLVFKNVLRGEFEAQLLDLVDIYFSDVII
ncbi:hypothetical protein CDIK_1830 [Cucumispora dikerogammari]|nr:hypothetical protein CDIK_1830 [Cucumispora dikerogammari]